MYVAFVSQSVQLVQNKKKGSRRRVSSAVFKVPTVTPKKYTGNRYRYSRRAEARLLAPTRGQAGLLLVYILGVEPRPGGGPGLVGEGPLGAPHRRVHAFLSLYC